MGDAIGEMLPAAVGVAISPVPIIAVVFMLLTPRGKSNALAFLFGWWGGLALAGGISLALASGATAAEGAEPAAWVILLKAVLGCLLLVLAAKSWHERHAGPAAPPKWMAALDQFSSLKSGGLGALLAAVNPKNLLLVIAGAAAIASTGISAGEQAGSLIVFILIASIGVALPLVLTFILGERSRAFLDDLRSWLEQSNATIMAVLLLVIGVKLIGDAISGL